MSLIGQTLAHFRITAKLGEGGMGVVYLAEDSRLKRQVALKVLPPDLASSSERYERFRREAEALAALNHPNIVTIHSIEHDGGVHFLTMEKVEGRSLDALEKDGPATLSQFLEIAIPLSEALAAAHARGIVHRDLKPANIMVTDEDQRVKVLDFGLAKLTPTDAEVDSTLAMSAEMTQEGTILGTVPYMSPEQVLGKPSDHRSDLFALGIILHEMLAGSRPFVGDVPAALISSILKDEPRSLTEVRVDMPPQLVGIIERCLKKAPAERPQSAGEVLDALRIVQQGLLSGSMERASVLPSSVDVAPEAPVSRPRAWRWRKALAVVGAVIAIATAAWVASRWFLQPSGRTAGRAAAGSTVVSLVALPSQVFAPDAEAYLTDAIPSNLSTHLFGIEGVETRMPPTSQQVEQVGGDLDKIARAYDVSTFVRSSVTSAPSGLAISVQLVDADTKTLIWSEEFRGERAEYLEMVRHAAEGIRAYLLPGAGVPSEIASDTTSSEAELALQHGRYAANRYNNHHEPADFDTALAAYETALELEPGSANVTAAIADLYSHKFEVDYDPVFLATTQEWLDRTFELNPDHGPAWGRQAYIGLYSDTEPTDPFESLGYALKAVALDPSISASHLMLGLVLNDWSSTLAVAAYREAARLNPLYLYPLLNLSQISTDSGHPEEGLRYADRTLELEPDMPMVHRVRSLALTMLGRFDEAEAPFALLTEARDEGRFSDAQIEIARMALAVERLLSAGDYGDARALINETLNSDVLSGPDYRLVASFAARDQADEALRILERRSELGFWIPYDDLALREEYESLRGDRRFETIVEQLRADFERLLDILEEARGRGELPEYLDVELEELTAELG